MGYSPCSVLALVPALALAVTVECPSGSPSIRLEETVTKLCFLKPVLTSGDTRGSVCRMSLEKWPRCDCEKSVESLGCFGHGQGHLHMLTDTGLGFSCVNIGVAGTAGDRASATRPVSNSVPSNASVNFYTVFLSPLSTSH